MNRSSADVFTNNVRGARRLSCIFCKGSHYNDECDKYVTLSDRKKRLSQQARCFICLKIGHMSIKVVLIHRRNLVHIVEERHFIIDVYVLKNLRYPQ